MIKKEGAPDALSICSEGGTEREGGRIFPSHARDRPFLEPPLLYCTAEFDQNYRTVRYGT